MNYFDNMKRKQITMISFLIFIMISKILSNYELFYYRASDVIIALDSLFFIIYAFTDAKKWPLYPKLAYGIISSLMFVNLFSAVRICSLKYYNTDKSASEIDVILANDYSNYITQYTQPFIIFAVIILFILVVKLKRNQYE